MLLAEKEQVCEVTMDTDRGDIGALNENIRKHGISGEASGGKMYSPKSKMSHSSSSGCRLFTA